jgi:hypothetical protein
MKKAILFAAVGLVLGTSAAHADCNEPVDQSNVKQVLTNIVGSIATDVQAQVVESKIIGLNGSVISNNVAKSSAAMTAKLSSGKEINYTILVENGCMIGGFGGVE